MVTSTGPGLVWTGTNTTALNTWNISTTTNWLVNGTPTSYHQIITPGDAVTFNDSGSGTVILNTNVSPASVTISNTTKIYTFTATGIFREPQASKNSARIRRSCRSAIIIILVIRSSVNGVLQVGTPTSISPVANVAVGPSGTLQLAGFSQTIPELSGSGIVDNSSGLDLILTLGSAAGSTWSGSIQDHGAGAIALTKNGTGTWVVGGTNRLAHGGAFTITNAFNAGTTILTNGGVISSPFLVPAIANNANNTATMIVDGGMLAVSNSILAVGNATGATGTMIVNNGTVFHGGNANGFFGAANTIVVGGGGGTGVLTVNGGQVLNTQGLVLGQNATGSGTLNLNGGLLQATAIVPNNTPAVSVANFNGGTLQAATNSGDFLQGRQHGHEQRPHLR